MECYSSSIVKTTNGGNDWFSLTNPVPSLEIFDMSILNADTFWLASSSGVTGGIFKTITGGINWMQQFGGTSGNPSKVYFFDAN